MPQEPLPERRKAPRIAQPRRVVSISWNDHETVGDVTTITLVAYAIAAALAVFGLPPVSLHSPLHFVGIMDPLCGMTRAVRLLALGDVGTAIRYNPASPLLALLSLGILARAAVGRCTGRWLILRVDRSHVLLAVSALLVVGLWINQQAHAALLM